MKINVAPGLQNDFTTFPCILLLMVLVVRYNLSWRCVAMSSHSAYGSIYGEQGRQHYGLRAAGYNELLF